MEKNDNSNNNNDSNNSDNNNNYDNNKKLQKLASKLEVALKLPSVIRTDLMKEPEIWFSFFFK